MKSPIRSLAVLSCLAFLFVDAFVLAQTPPKSIAKATLYISVGDATDIWLNGHLLVSQDPNLDAQRGFVTKPLDPDQLCYFGKENILSLSLEGEIEDDPNEDPDKDKVGIAYVLELDFSDNQKLFLASDEGDQHRFYQTDDQPNTDPDGWKEFGFDDSSWKAAQIVPPPSVITKVLHNPKDGKTVQFLYAFDGGTGGRKVHHGTRSLFRRKFALDIVPAPNCPQPPPTSTPRPKPQPTATWTFTPVPPPPTDTPVPPTATPKPRPTRRPTLTPTPVPPAPTATPVIRRHKPLPTFTPVPLPPLAATPTPIRRQRPKPTFTPRFTPTPSFTPEPERVESAPETIVFVNPPVNVDVSFADGPGRYKLEVTDGQGNHLKTLYDKTVSYEKESWITWDGTNEDGQLLPAARYRAVLTKDGKVLHRIVLDWIKNE